VSTEGEITVVVDSNHAEIKHQADALRALACLQHHGAQKHVIDHSSSGPKAHHLICSYPDEPETIFDVIIEKTEEGFWRLKSAYEKQDYASVNSYFRDLLLRRTHSGANPWSGNVIYEFRIPNAPFLP
jgi:hypothetical protein